MVTFRPIFSRHLSPFVVINDKLFDVRGIHLIPFILRPKLVAFSIGRIAKLLTETVSGCPVKIVHRPIQCKF